MQVTETLNSGLKREIKVTVPASDLEEKLLKRLSDVKDKVRINGFRPGKVPVQHLRKVYGKSFMAEVVNEILTNSTREIITGRGEKAAMQPEVKMTEDEKEADKILSGGADFEFQLAYEVIPPIELKDVSGIKVTRKVYDVPESEIDEQVKRIAESTRTYEAKDGAAEEGDRLTIDFLGKIDGEAFAGGEAKDQTLVLGLKTFIPGFEDQLVGARAGDEKVVTVTFPADYTAAHLAGKEAAFEVTVKEVARPLPLELNDETAKSLGIESLERLREVVKGQIESQYGQMTRQKVKRELLDALDAAYQFEAPSKLVDAEFDNIWLTVNRDLDAAGRTFADEETTEEAARADYRRLAERRVRLGLVLAEIGEKAGVQVADDEVQRALFDTVRSVPAAQQQQVFDFYRNNPSALANLRAPIFEEKVVDHLLTQVDVTDKHVSKEELTAEEPDEATGKPAKAAEKAATE
jgi:trigger factor